jgi:DNA-directed RNA polymerase specialized sigma24 family protein
LALSVNHSGIDEISQEQFDRLLQWLDPDREIAGTKYEGIRKRLIKIFVCRGSPAPEELSDKTINRVALKLPEIQSNYVGEPARYFYGVANNIFRESFRKEKAPIVQPSEPPKQDEEEELIYTCLEECMDKLGPAQRDLVLGYYWQEKRDKINHRKELAESQGMGVNALRIRACRIRAALQKCVEDCRSKGRAAVK